MGDNTSGKDTVLQSESGDEVRIKSAFEERYHKLLGDRYEEFISISLTFLRKSIRINTLKKPIPEVEKRLEEKGWQLESVPWCASGFWIEHEDGRLDIGNTLEHALGLIYVQEAASMLPPEALDLEEGNSVLDMCASPGSKTTQMAQILDGSGIVVGNDVNGKRLTPLGMNLQRMGTRNAVVTRGSGTWFRHLGETFDRVLVDAPCSGTGAIRKSLKTLKMWNPGAVTRLTRLQLSLLESGYSCLRPGGTLVYSTCTLEPEENEGVVSQFLGRNGDAQIVPIDLELKRSDPFLDFDGEQYDERVKNCLRIWPQDNDTEGFFVAKFCKPQDI